MFVLGGSLVFEPACLAAAAAIGACIGEFTGYMFGLGGRKAFKKRYGKKIDFLERLVKKYGSLTIFIFAATPLPDDLIFIPLGIMRYSIVKAFVPAFLGKLVMYLTVAYGGRFLVEAVGDFFGVTNDQWPAIISTILGVAVFMLMLEVDWEKRLGKYLNKDTRKLATTKSSAAQ